MKLTRLRLLGFKSFGEPTDILIEPGLTGVVGPNGCGKSNLLAALRWAMGETSYKSMRGTAMEGVIFAGSEARPGADGRDRHRSAARTPPRAGRCRRHCRSAQPPARSGVEAQCHRGQSRA